MPFESVRHATERDGIGHWIDHHARADDIAVRGLAEIFLLLGNVEEALSLLQRL